MLGSKAPSQGGEQSQEFPSFLRDEAQSGTLCGTPDTQSGRKKADLRTIIDACPMLPDATQASIVVRIRRGCRTTT